MLTAQNTLLFLTCFVALLGINTNLSCQENSTGIQFDTDDLSTAIELADWSNELLFVNAVAFNQSQADIPVDSIAAKFINENFFSARINLNDFQYFHLKQILNLQKKQSFLFFSPEGTLLGIFQNVSNSNELLLQARAMFNRTKIRDDKHAKEHQRLRDQYESGDFDLQTLYNFAFNLKIAGHKDSYKIFNEFITNILEEDYKSNEVRFLIGLFADNMNSLAIDLYLLDKDYFINKRTLEDYENQIKLAAFNSIHLAIRNDKKKSVKKDIDRVIEVLEKAGIREQKEFVYNLKAYYYKETGNWTEYSRLTNEFLIDSSSPIDYYYNVSKTIAVLAKNQSEKLYKQATNWVMLLIKSRGKSYENLLVLARLLDAQDQCENAYVVAYKAMKVVKESGKGNDNECFEFLQKLNDKCPKKVEELRKKLSEDKDLDFFDIIFMNIGR